MIFGFPILFLRKSFSDGAGAFQRLLDSVQGIFDRMDSLDPRILDDAMNGEKDAKVPQCLLISNSTLHELSGETAKLKILGLLCQVQIFAVKSSVLIACVRSIQCKA